MISTNHRRNFFNIILNAPSVDRIITSNSMNQVSVDASQCNDYYLHKLDVPRPKEGGSSGQTASLDNKNIEIAEWISKVMSNEQRSNFLFPAKSEGPDLMFFLSNGPNPMILCAVQVLFAKSPKCSSALSIIHKYKIQKINANYLKLLLKVQNKPNRTPAKQTHAGTRDFDQMAWFMPVSRSHYPHLRRNFDSD